MITCLNWWSKNGHKHNINVLIYLTAPSKELLSLCIVACRGKMRFEFWGTPLLIYFWISFTAKFFNRWAAIGAFSFLYDDIWALDVFMMGIEDSLLKEPTICSLRLTRTVIFCRKRCRASSYCNRCMGNALNATGQWREPVQARFVQATMPWPQPSSHLQLQGVELTLIAENILGLGLKRISAHNDIWS